MYIVLNKDDYPRKASYESAEGPQLNLEQNGPLQAILVSSDMSMDDSLPAERESRFLERKKHDAYSAANSGQTDAHLMLISRIRRKPS
jgi:hypothetical protein